MQVFIGKPALDFTAKAIMPGNEIEDEFTLSHYAKGYKIVLFFYPLNFTFVCPSEIIAFHNRLGEFTERNTRVIAVSVDSHFSHLAWKNTPHNKGGVGQIQIPMISDLKKNISSMYNVLNEDGVSLRGTFLIDKNFIVRHILVNDLPLGRNVDHTLQVIDALIHHQQHGEVCPAGWRKGEEAMTASHEGVAHYLGSHAEKL
ncbi:peroxiredoxin [Rickettsia endosymbiont of Halotydeus destructor]|uniref:peroxiredoxin n=1 Tax=Rickettsia endosymbiont of Halotydeus destructor TaxID=2996754 RepID=UPI003BB1082B